MSVADLVLDVEVYRNFFYLGIKRLSDGKRVGYEFSDRADFDRRRVRAALARNRSIGFNSLNYDLPMIYLALDGASNAQIKAASDRIIKERLPWWRVEDELGIKIPKIDHIDIFETNPSVKKGLKALNASMHHKRLQELPFHEAATLSHADMDALIDYCQFGDIDGTEMLFRVLDEPIKLRELLRARYGTGDLRSKSDAQVGEAIIKSEVERIEERKVKRVVTPDGYKFRYKPPEWMAFETPMMQAVFDQICATDIEVVNGGVTLPKAFEAFDIRFGDLALTLGIGGIHSTEANRAVASDADSVLIDADVASQYPSIIMKLGLYPKALGATFLTVYKGLIDTRLAAKRAKDKGTDKGLKISINGAYGKLGSAYSVLCAYELMVTTTLTGQLSIIMLIERAFLRGIPVVSANTDGVIFRCPRAKFGGFEMRDGKPTERLAASELQEIVAWWEALTSFALEFAEYRAVYSQSVNSYVAVKPDGSFKRKGKLANHWRAELPWGGRNTDYDMEREGLKKAPCMTICADAALGMILHGIPPEKTISECHDVREFITVTTATGGATWGPGAPLIEERARPDGKGTAKGLFGYEGEFYLGKVVRFYWSTQGNPIVRIKGHHATGTRGIVPTTDGCRPIMDLPDDYAAPPDLDRARYIKEAYAILRDIGFATAPRAPTILEYVVTYLRNYLGGGGMKIPFINSGGPWAYYNDFDDKAVLWLKELIRQGCIADGEVDGRSILEVSADELRDFTQCHFFAGIGGWSYALRLLGWPDDMPVWTGSPPCQPFSVAGQQKGKNDDRHLAPHFAELIGRGRPPFVFGEQVASTDVFGKPASSNKRGLGDAFESGPKWCWLDDLSDRLEATHYAVGASDISAAIIGAPHIRQRTFFGAVRLADTERGASERHGLELGSAPGSLQGAAREQRLWADAIHVLNIGGLADTYGARCEGIERGWSAGAQGEPDRHGAKRSGHDGLADTYDTRSQGRIPGRIPGRADTEWGDLSGRSGRGGSDRNLAEGNGPENRVFQPRKFGPWPHEVDRLWGDADWLFCRDGKWRAVEPGTFPLDDGIPARMGRLRGYGNAVVPQAAAAFVKIFLESLAASDDP